MRGPDDDGDPIQMIRNALIASAALWTLIVLTLCWAA